MTALHAYFHLRQQQPFRRLLDAPSRSQPSSQAGLSSSGGKSWNRPSSLSSAVSTAVDVNARDQSGRTVLHLATSAHDPSATEYVRMLLAHPGISINLADKESQWTALHRALYHGNIATASLLLQRPDIDVTLKDLEGYTAYDLYNSTVEGTKPALPEGKLAAELFTWGANRNATLGVGDGDDRAFPEQIFIEFAQAYSEDAPLKERFTSIRTQQIAMSKLHTAVVTDEFRANLRVCGFGSGGRLGPGQHTQYNLASVPAIPHTIVSIALGQDHTLALTNAGEVLSWGLNRFAQLGYVIETSTGASTRAEEPIQSTPRKVSGLRGKLVRGVAACKTASVCWTDKEVYSWGTNNGQLGYDKTMQPVQILPRVVSKIAQPVLSVTITDTAMACLLDTSDVVCFYNDNHFRVNFPAHAFPSEINAYRPPHANRNVIEKITSCDSMFAALSSNGELFTFNLPTPPESTGTVLGKAREFVKPQRVWALRRKFSAVKDVALGADGSIIICTESGHVFVRARTAGKTFKFQRVPYLQRVVKVAANNTGAYGALRVDVVPIPFVVAGNTLPEDLALIQPYRANRTPVPLVVEDGQKGQEVDSVDNGLPGDVDEEEDKLVTKDRDELCCLCNLLVQHKQSQKADSTPAHGLFGVGSRVNHGADLIIHAQSALDLQIPAHSVVLAVRSDILADIIAGKSVIDLAGIKISRVKHTSAYPLPRAPWKDPVHIRIAGCQPISVLILLTYLYSDSVLAIWDWRIAKALQEFLVELKIKPQQVKEELQRCAQVLQLPALLSALEGAFKREVRTTLSQQFSDFFATRLIPLVHTFHHGSRAVDTDVVLCLEDREVPCHSAVLRARSPTFKAFFDDDDWTKQRWETNGTIRMQFKHLQWRSMQYVVRYLYGGDIEMFDVLAFVHTMEELLEFMFDVMAAANELLLDRLVQICSSVIVRRVNVSTVCAILSEASYYNAEPLVPILQNYVAQNLEMLLEGKILDYLASDQVKLLAAHVRKEQFDKSPVTRSNILVDTAMEKNHDWLALQDMPQVIAPTSRPFVPREAAKLSPPLSTIRAVGTIQLSPPLLASRPRSPDSSPALRPHASLKSHRNSTAIGDDDVFMMDPEPIPPMATRDDRPTRPETLDQGSKANGWKALSTPRVDMKAIMAEAETDKAPLQRSAQPSAAPTSSVASEAPSWRTPSKQSKVGPSDMPRPTGGSPWKSIANSAVAGQTSERTPPMTPQMQPLRLKEDSPTAPKGSFVPVGGPLRSQPPTPKRPGMGPTFTPSRVPSKTSTSSPSIRRTSSTATAWTLPPVQPTVQPSASSTISLTAIQQLEMERLAPKRDKRSLKEIQEEERARQVEDDFLRWWAAEEERLRQEEEAVVTATAATTTKVSPKPRHKAKKAKGAAGQKADGKTDERTEGLSRSDRKGKKADEKKGAIVGEIKAEISCAPDGEDNVGGTPTLRLRRRPCPHPRPQTKQSASTNNSLQHEGM